MSAKERVKRPKLVRQEPIRGWSTLFEAPRSEGEATGAAPSPAAAGDVISKSVELGYRVVDEYVRQGQRAARLLSQPSTNPQAMVGDVQRIYLDHLSQLTRFWMEAMQMATPAAGMAPPMANAEPAPPPASGPVTDSPPTPSPTPVERAAVRIEVVAQQPVTVSLELRPEASGKILVAHALRAADAEKGRLADITFQTATADEPARLRLVVPAGQASGTYSGLLVDAASNRPMGTLSVDVADAGA